MKIIYLTWGETPRSYGVFGSQVIGQFLETAKLCPNDEFHFISALPVVHSGMVREKWFYPKELAIVKKQLDSIKFHWLPIYATQNFVNSSKCTFQLMHGFAHYHLKQKLFKIEPDIVHCRSYHATWAALQVRKKYDLNYKIIFDGRGLWPEEVALKKKWTDDSEDYLFLKGIEQIILTESEVSISVSDTMHYHYDSLGGHQDKIIYLSADVDQIPVHLLNEVKEEQETIKFCYVGALSEEAWHQPSQLLDLYRHLRTFFKRTRLTIVTTTNHNKLKSFFNEFLEDEIVLIATRTRLELKIVLEGQDFGILPFRKNLSIMERFVGKTMLATKTAEYFASGLPMICNKFCGGAAELTCNNGLGIVYDPEKVSKISYMELDNLLSNKMTEKCREFAKENFDYKVNAKKYAFLYKEMNK